MPDATIESFLAMLKANWPSVRETTDSLGPVWDRHFSRATESELRSALDAEKCDNPDALRPSFGNLIDRVRGSGGGQAQRTNDFQRFLINLRWAAKDQNNPINCDEWTDDSVWRHWPGSQEQHNVDYWRRYHVDKGLPVPACLAEYEAAPRTPLPSTGLKLWE